VINLFHVAGLRYWMNLAVLRFARVRHIFGSSTCSSSERARGVISHEQTHSITRAGNFPRCNFPEPVIRLRRAIIKPHEFSVVEPVAKRSAYVDRRGRGEVFDGPVIDERIAGHANA